MIKDERPAIKDHCKSYVFEASKVYLLRAAPLSAGKEPREETLRKLYMLNTETADIAALIKNLKRIRLDDELNGRLKTAAEVYRQRYFGDELRECRSE